MEDYTFTTKLSGKPIGAPWDASGWDGSNDWDFASAADDTPEQLYALWDGEEEGLLGSTEWNETHGDELRQHAAVYINSDSNGRGFLEVGGSHTLERLVTQVALSVR